MVDMLVTLIKLVSGEDILGEILKKDNLNITVKNPLKFYDYLDEEGELSSGIRYWLDVCPQEVYQINRTGVLTMAVVDEETAEFYYDFFLPDVTPILDTPGRERKCEHPTKH